MDDYNIDRIAEILRDDGLDAQAKHVSMHGEPMRDIEIDFGISGFIYATPFPGEVIVQFYYGKAGPSKTLPNYIEWSDDAEWSMGLPDPATPAEIAGQIRAAIVEARADGVTI